MPWKIQDKMDGVFEEGNYTIVILDFKFLASKDGGEGILRMNFKMLGGDADGQKGAQIFPMAADNLGILATFIHGTGEFDPKVDQMEDPGEELAEQLTERLGGKAFDIEYSVTFNKKANRSFSKITVIGPANALD